MYLSISPQPLPRGQTQEILTELNFGCQNPHPLDSFHCQNPLLIPTLRIYNVRNISAKKIMSMSPGWFVSQCPLCLCENLVSVPWVVCEYLVSVPWVVCENLVSVPWVVCENLVSVPWVVCENFVSVPWVVCENLVSVPWVVCENLVSVPWVLILTGALYKQSRYFLPIHCIMLAILTLGYWHLHLFHS